MLPACQAKLSLKHDWYQSYSEGWKACLDEATKLGPLYTYRAAADEIDLLRADLTTVKADRDAYTQNAINLRAKLVERDALLDRLRNHLIAKGVLGEFGPELFQILNIEVPERLAGRNL